MKKDNNKIVQIKTTLSTHFFRAFITMCFLLTFVLSVFAQENNTPKKEKNKIIWMPVIASSPANGFMFGVAPAMNWQMGNKPLTTSYSSLLGSVIYTTKKQLLITLKGTVFFEDNQSLIMQDIRYFQTSQPTFGLGTGPQSAKLVSNGFEFEDGSFSDGIDDAQMMKFNFFRLHETYFRRISNSKIYAGLGYHLDIHSSIEDQLLNLSTSPPSITSHYAYSITNGFDPTHYTLSGISANAMYDTRDNTVNPYKGMYSLVTLRLNPEFLGSSKYASTLWAEARKYFGVSKTKPQNVIGFWVYGNFQLGGVLPYMDLPALGWDQFGRSGRAYTQGRFRGQSLGYAEAEWRFPLQKISRKLGGVVFVNTTTANNKDANISFFEHGNIGYGAGLRYMLNEKSRTNICIDYGMGNYNAKGFYLGVNEVF